VKKRSHRTLQAVLPHLMDSIASNYENNPMVLEKIWAEILGKNLTGKTRILSYKEGILTVSIINPTLYSVLCMQKKDLLHKFQQKLSQDSVKELVFKVGA
jgi:hypothetical protein